MSVNIHWTNHAKEVYNLKLDTNGSSDAFHHWNVNVLNVERKKCLLLVNKETLYTVFIFNVPKPSIMNFHTIFFEALLSQLKADGLWSPSNEQKIYSIYKDMHSLSTNNDQTTLATLRYHKETLEWYLTRIGNSFDVIAEYVTNAINDTPISSIKFKSAKDMMLKNLESYSID